MAKKQREAERSAAAGPYSPGPWRLREGELCDSAGNVLASFPYTIGGEEDRANAQLARAAPELAEAAAALLRRLDHLGSYGFKHGAEKPEREALRQALARALGVDPENVYPWPSEAEAAELAGDPRPFAEAMADAHLIGAREPLARALARIATGAGNPAELAREALDLAEIADPAAWLRSKEAEG
jgi:hypothetical protein